MLGSALEERVEGVLTSEERRVRVRLELGDEERKIADGRVVGCCGSSALKSTRFMQELRSHEGWSCALRGSRRGLGA